MKHKIEVWVTFHYGSYHLAFKKNFDWNFTPFPEMVLFEEHSLHGYENLIEFKTNAYSSTTIMYMSNMDSPKDSSWFVEVRNTWKNPVTDDTIDYTIENFARFGWTREDTTDIQALKHLMLKEYERSNR